MIGSSSIMSPVDKIENLSLHPFPAGRAVKIDRAIRVGSTTLAVGANGKIYWTNKGGCHYLPGDWPWLPGLMKGLQRLGVITAAQYKQHMEWNERVTKKKNDKYSAQGARRAFQSLGIKLTKTQADALDLAEGKVAEHA